MEILWSGRTGHHTLLPFSRTKKCLSNPVTERIWSVYAAGAVTFSLEQEVLRICSTFLPNITMLRCWTTFQLPGDHMLPSNDDGAELWRIHCSDLTIPTSGADNSVSQEHWASSESQSQWFVHINAKALKWHASLKQFNFLKHYHFLLLWH